MSEGQRRHRRGCWYVYDELKVQDASKIEISYTVTTRRCIDEQSSRGAYSKMFGKCRSHWGVSVGASLGEWLTRKEEGLACEGRREDVD